MKKPSLKTIFWLLIVNFLLVISSMLVMGFVDTQIPHFLFFGATFLALGIIFTLLVFKENPEKRLKAFFLLTGFSAVGFFAFSILHNLLYALGIVAKAIPVIFYLAQVLNAFFFMISILVCPIGFIVGVIGSIVYLRKK